MHLIYFLDKVFFIQISTFLYISTISTFPFWDLFAAQLHLFWGITTFWIIPQINIIWSSIAVSILNVPCILSESPVEQLNKMVHTYGDMPQIHQQILRPEFIDSIIKTAKDQSE